MLHEREIDSHPYRAPLNPAFVRRVREKRKAEAAARREAEARRELEAMRAKALRDAEERGAMRREAEQAKAAFEEAKAKLTEQYKAELEDERKAAFERALKALGEAGGNPVVHTYSIIEARAMRVFRVSKAELRGTRRSREIVFARQFVMYWASRLTTLSTPRIGRFMGGRDHTTILSGKRAYVRKRSEMGRRLREAR